MRPASTQALTFRYVVVLLLIALLSLIGYLTLSHVISRGRQLMRFVRISDEQQMCAQRVAYFSLRLSQAGSPSEHDVCRTRLKEETGRLLEDEDAQVRKGGPLDQAAPIAPELLPLYFGEPSHLDKEVRDYVALARKVAAVPDGELVFDDPDVATIQEKNYNELLEGFNKGVRMLRTNWENERHLVVFAQLAIFLLTLATLVVAGFFVFRPMVKLIVAKNRQMMAFKRRRHPRGPSALL
jgi:hypothetical protein